MSAEEVKAKVLEVVRGFCSKLDVIDKDTLLECDLGLDYLDTVELIVEIEDELGIDIEDEAVEHVKTVGDLVREAQKECLVQSAQCQVRQPHQAPSTMHQALKQRVTDTVEDEDLAR